MKADTKVKRFIVGTLKVEVHKNSQEAAEAAARAAATKLIELGKSEARFGVIFATGASQIKTLDPLTKIRDLPWPQIRGFHLDEYIGMSPDHPASFRRYLREHLATKVHMNEFNEIDGTAANIEQMCDEYTKKLRLVNPKLCLLGIGENGHLAFNEPAEAQFDDPRDVKVVKLDMLCRQQQFSEGWFHRLDEVPEEAITLTIPALFRVSTLIGSVPGPRKASIVRRTLEGPITAECPAAILRTHPDATVYLDLDSASALEGLPEYDRAV
jgi:glucosamine-6-phosphate deaminase